MYIAIEGVIGVGKTSLARLLQPSYQSNLLLEIFEENPFLKGFYQDRERYAFQTQIFFLLSRYHQQHNNIPELLKSGKNLITDYTFDKDALFAGVNLKGDELDVYHSVHHAPAERIPIPDLTVYLKASTDVLLQRIALRDRAYERSMETAYIAALNETYDKFFSQVKNERNVLIVDTNTLDFVHNPPDLQFIDNRIKQCMHLAPFQAELPID